MLELRYTVYVLLILSGVFLGCRVRQSGLPETERSLIPSLASQTSAPQESILPKASLKFVKGNELQVLSLKIEDEVLGGFNIPKLIVEREEDSDFTHYKICNVAANVCKEGQSFRKEVLPEIMPQGMLDFQARSCVEARRSSTSENCGAWKFQKYQQMQISDPKIAEFLSKQIQIEQQMKGVASQAAEEMARYKEQTKNLANKDEQIESMADNFLTANLHLVGEYYASGLYAEDKATLEEELKNPASSGLGLYQDYWGNSTQDVKEIEKEHDSSVSVSKPKDMLGEKFTNGAMLLVASLGVFLGGVRYVVLEHHAVDHVNGAKSRPEIDAKKFFDYRETGFDWGRVEGRLKTFTGTAKKSFSTLTKNNLEELKLAVERAETQSKPQIAAEDEKISTLQSSLQENGGKYSNAMMEINSKNLSSNEIQKILDAIESATAGNIDEGLKTKFGQENINSLVENHNLKKQLEVAHQAKVGIIEEQIRTNKLNEKSTTLVETHTSELNTKNRENKLKGGVMILASAVLAAIAVNMMSLADGTVDPVAVQKQEFGKAIERLSPLALQLQAAREEALKASNEMWNYLDSHQSAN